MTNCSLAASNFTKWLRHVCLAADHLLHLSRAIIKDVYPLMARFARNAIVLREPDGTDIFTQSGGGRDDFLWAADEFDDKFPGFKLLKKKVCKNATDKKRYTLMCFTRLTEGE